MLHYHRRNPSVTVMVEDIYRGQGYVAGLIVVHLGRDGDDHPAIVDFPSVGSGRLILIQDY